MVFPSDVTGVISRRLLVENREGVSSIARHGGSRVIDPNFSLPVRTEFVTRSGEGVEIGKQYFLRTVTYHLTGKVKKIVGKFLILSNASWIADSGRFSEAMKKGIDKQANAEIEPFSEDVIVNTDSITDACVYPYQLPDDVK